MLSTFLTPLAANADDQKQPVVNFYLSFENMGFFEDEFVAQSGRKTIAERQIEFPEGRFGKGIRMRFVPETLDPHGMTLAPSDLDLTTAVVFNTGRNDQLGFNEPFFWGTGKLNPRLGAVAFWVKAEQPYSGPLFKQASVAFGRRERDLIGIKLDGLGILSAYLRDARYVYHEIESGTVWKSGKWNHVVLNWDWANGLELWLNGERIAWSKGSDSWFETLLPGLFRLPAPLVTYDEFYIMDRPLSSKEIHRLMTSNQAPGPEKPYVKRSGEEIAGITRSSGAAWKSDFPVVTPDTGALITEIQPLSAGDGHIPGWYVIDGRSEMAWPHEYAFFTIIIGDADFHAEKVDITTPPASRVNYVTLTGNLTGVKVQSGSGGMNDAADIFRVPRGEGFYYGSTVTSDEGATFRIPFTERYGTPEGFEGDLNLPISGEKRIHGIELYHVSATDAAPRGKQLVIAPLRENLDTRYDFAFHSLTARDERTVSIASENPRSASKTICEIGAFRRLSVMSEPFRDQTGVSSVTLSIPVRTTAREEALFIRIHDPAVPSRLWNRFAVTLKGFEGDYRLLELAVDFQDLVLTGGDRLWIDLGCAGGCELLLGDKKTPAALTVETVPAYIAVDAYAEKEIIPGNAQYSKMYEFMPWNFTGREVKLEEPYCFGGPFDMLFPALAVKRVKPDHFVANFLEKFCLQIYDQHAHPTGNVEIPLKTITDPHGAPDWAVYMRDFNTFRHGIADWMAENQNPDGQIGGGWNDDTLLIGRNMPDVPLDGHERAGAVFDSIHVGLERTRLYLDGYCQVRPIDRSHAGGFIAYRYYTVLNNLGQAYPMEREMQSAWRYGHPERTPVNYGEGEAFINSVNVLKWYWGEDVPEKPYQSKPIVQVTQDLRRSASLHNDYTFYRFTDAYVHRDDNIPLGSLQLHDILLGGQLPSRWDAHIGLAVMWPSGGGPDVARIVLRADDTSVEAVCYSFDGRKRDLQMRLCRILDGRYRIGLYAESDSVGKTGGIIWETEKVLRRFDIVTLPVPPRTPLVIRIEQLERHNRPAELPDLALDLRDIQRQDSSVTVIVHNLGNGAAENIAVRLMDGDEPLQEKTIARLDAPTDFVAKQAAVTFENVPESHSAKVVLDPDEKIMEIIEENNSVLLR